ncbi:MULTISPECIES: hypothetical protein [Nocardiopsis]|uniref:hypothetical protein n=1 Tax=Nocardiopsis TaxID=2013 RepID=UPI000345A27B|nr:MULTISPECIES: hypothetical protein [Nocardiopsis]
MSEFLTTLHLRIYDATRALRRAHARGDDELCLAQAAEIEDLVEIAARHGIDIDSGYRTLVEAA